MPQLPDHAAKSKLAEELSAASEEQEVKTARSEIFKDLSLSVKHIRNTISDEDVDSKTRLRAAREHLLLAGMYVEKVEHSGKVEFEPFIVSRGDE